MRKIAALLALAVVGACSEFSATPTPTDGGTDDDAGTPADGGPVVAEDAGAARDGAAPMPCPSGATCIDFEDASLGGAIRSGDGCTLDDRVAHSGGRALHCKGAGRSYFELGQTFPAAAPLAFRAFVRGNVVSGEDAPSLGYVGFMNKKLDFPVMMAGDQGARHYGLWWATTAGGFIASDVANGGARWTCVEAAFEDPSTLRFFIDGSQVDSARLNASLGADPLAFRWGLPYRPFLESTVAEVVIDDIAIGTTRIGCE